MLRYCDEAGLSCVYRQDAPQEIKQRSVEHRSKALLVSLALRRRQGEVEISKTLSESATSRCDAQIRAGLTRMFDIDIGDATAHNATRSEEYSEAAN
jgi:hypothetical protein